MRCSAGGLWDWIHSDVTKLGMHVVSKPLRFAKTHMDKMNQPRVFRTLLAWFTGLTVGAFAIGAQGAAVTPSGIAWQSRGTWRIDGEIGSIRTGDAILPGSLLLAKNPRMAHSIVVLLPDGQRVLYECFTEEQCERGFRVPLLYEEPTPFATELLARIRAVLIRDRNVTQAKTQLNRLLPREEALAALGPDNWVSIGGLAASLPDGRYTYEASNGEAGRIPSSKRSIFVKRGFVKKGPSIHLALPSKGIYDFVVRDDFNRPRIDLFIAAVTPAEAPESMNSVRRAEQLMKQWNSEYQGWPMDDFQRAYFEALALKIGPQSTQGSERATTRAPRPDTTAEPVFSPAPGVFEGDLMVQLRCVTPGAAIHYTVDTSQPVKSSPVYAGAIAVKKTELTVKAFASSAGKKDSAVVTGIFRIKQ